MPVDDGGGDSLPIALLAIAMTPVDRPGVTETREQAPVTKSLVSVVHMVISIAPVVPEMISLVLAAPEMISLVQIAPERISQVPVVHEMILLTPVVPVTISQVPMLMGLTLEVSSLQVPSRVF